VWKLFVLTVVQGVCSREWEPDGSTEDRSATVKTLRLTYMCDEGGFFTFKN